jgi:hypothetical protein
LGVTVVALDSWVWFEVVEPGPSEDGRVSGRQAAGR